MPLVAQVDVTDPRGCIRRVVFNSTGYVTSDTHALGQPEQHRCPHDGWLENLIISETIDTGKKRATAIRTRLLAAYHDGYIEFFYPRVFAYTLESPSCVRGLGDWLYDEFRLSPGGNVIHEIEWAGAPGDNGSRWVIEVLGCAVSLDSTVRFQ